MTTIPAGESETPRTDALAYIGCPEGVPFHDWLIQKYKSFARQLERELTALSAENAALQAEMTLVRKECDEAQQGCIKAAAYNTFIHGKDIPETIERARAALVKRVETTEQALLAAREDAERYRWIKEHITQACESGSNGEITDCYFAITDFSWAGEPTEGDAMEVAIDAARRSEGQ